MSRSRTGFASRIEPILLTSFLVLFYLVLVSSSMGVRGIQPSTVTALARPTRLTDPTIAMRPATFTQDFNTLFIITPLRIILGIIVILVVTFVIALRKRWIEISFESSPEEQLLPQGEIEDEPPARVNVAGGMELSSGKEILRMVATPFAEEFEHGFVKAELEKIEAEFKKVRVGLEAERSELEKTVHNLAREYEALRKLREELSDEKKNLYLVRQQLEKLRDHLTRGVV